MTPIILSQEIAAIPSATISSIEHRDSILALAKPITEVRTHEQLELAVKVLSDLAKITKETETARKAIKEPVLALGKAIDKVAADHVASVERESNRLKGYVNHFQTLQLREKEERERKAREDAAEATRKAAEAQKAIDAATDEDSKLDAQLALESASLAAQNAEQQLSVPTNTPRGMTTRVRYDFEIVAALNCIKALPEFWTWKKDDEAFKFERAVFLKALNKDGPESNIAALLPEEQIQTVTHAASGIRIFRDVSVSVRG